MNTTTYYRYGLGLNYTFQNSTLNIGIKPYEPIEKPLDYTISPAPSNIRYLVTDNPDQTIDMSYIIKSNKPDIHKINIPMGVPATGLTLFSREGLFTINGISRISNLQSQFSSFTRGINKPILLSSPTPTPTPTYGLTPTPSNTMGVTVTPTATSTLTPTPTHTATPSSTVPLTGSTLGSFNSIWNTVGFSGSGTSGSPYTKPAQTSYNAAGMQFTALSSGTLRITCSTPGMYSDYGIDFFKNGILLGTPPTFTDAYSGNGGNYNVNITLSVAANDVIRIGTDSNDYITWDSTLSIWLQ